MIRIFLHGPHARRTPLRAPALAEAMRDVAEEVPDPTRADLSVFAHLLDLENAPAAVAEDWRRRRRPIVLLSEEPFWDTVWGGRPLARRIMVDTRHGRLPAVQLNHATSRIFRFERIPYYLLTDHRFFAAYAHRLNRNAARRPRDWAEAWRDAPARAAFLFERRPDARHDRAWPAADLHGLCAWRTALAAALQDRGTAEVAGRGWTAGPSRFEVGNWHLDKLMRLDGRAPLIGAVENTHHPDYLTEKPFDAYACGALPLYVAGPRHRWREMGVPDAAWLNLDGLSPEDAAERVASWTPGAEAADAMHDACAALRARLGRPAHWAEERAALVRRLRQALRGVLEGEA